MATRGFLYLKETVEQSADPLHGAVMLADLGLDSRRLGGGFQKGIFALAIAGAA